MLDTIDTKTAQLYDLLSKDTPLSRDDFLVIQNSLNSMGHDCGGADSFMGRNTARGIISFLKAPEQMAFIEQVSDQVIEQLNKYGEAQNISRLLVQAALPEEERAALKEQIASLSANPDLLKDEAAIEQLQSSLKTLGYNTGTIDGDFGKNTAEALTTYLQDNPQNILTLDPDIMLQLMKKAQTADLQDIAKSVPEFNDRVKQHLIDMGVINDANIIRESENHDDVKDLQILLTVAARNPRGIDGIVGNKTIDAATNFMRDYPITTAQDIVTRPDDALDELIIPETKNTPAPKTGEPFSQDYTKLFEGDNGYGVDNLAIERAWAKVTGRAADQNMVAAYDHITVDPLNAARPLIVIDPGHGSDIGSNDKIDPGAVSKHVKGLSEVSVVDPLSEELAKQLYAQGYNVAFTRNPNEQLRVEGSHGSTLRVRPEFAHALADELNANGVVFISMHANAAANQRANGTRLYIDTDGARITNANSAGLARSLASEFSISSKQTATVQVGDLSVIDNFEDQVAKGDTISSAVLVELGFLTNKQDSAILADIKNNPSAAAQQIATGIDSHVQSVMPPPKDENIILSSKVQLNADL